MKTYFKNLLKQYKVKDQFYLVLHKTNKKIPVESTKQIKVLYRKLEGLVKQQDKIFDKSTDPKYLKKYMELNLSIDQTEKLLRRELKKSLNEERLIPISQ